MTSSPCWLWLLLGVWRLWTVVHRTVISWSLNQLSERHSCVSQTPATHLTRHVKTQPVVCLSKSYYQQLLLIFAAEQTPQKVSKVEQRKPKLVFVLIHVLNCVGVFAALSALQVFISAASVSALTNKFSRYHSRHSLQLKVTSDLKKEQSRTNSKRH